MKNTIFKSYTKKILRSEAFISVVIVFVLALGIIGTSYALYMDVDPDTNYQLVEVGDLSIGFDNGDNTITLENMTPTEDEIAIKDTNNIFSFYIYNTGTYTVDYDIKLIPDTSTTDANGNAITPNEVLPKYINYQICKDNSKNCTEVKTLGDATDDSTINNPIYSDSLFAKKTTDLTNPSAYYFLRVWINNTYTDTANKIIKYKVVIDAKNTSGYIDNKNTLAYKVLNNENTIVNDSSPKFDISETSEEAIYKTQDNLGISYYFRGKNSYNYLNLGKMCWRIVRIEGDGSIKLVLADSKNECDSSDYNQSSTSSSFIENLSVSYSANNYTKENGAKYEGSDIQQFLNCWLQGNQNCSGLRGYNDLEKTNYQENISVYVENKIDDSYLKEADWCNDISYDKTKQFPGENGDLSYYKHNSFIRLSNAIPTLKCDGNMIYKGKIGLLSADEVMFAGIPLDRTGSDNNYLMTNASKEKWYTMTPLKLYINDLTTNYYSPDIALINTEGYLIGESDYITSFNAIRPSIVLKANTLYASGNGTYQEPYEIK